MKIRRWVIKYYGRYLGQIKSSLSQSKLMKNLIAYHNYPTGINLEKVE